ncbi:MAG: DinB family protein, partial [Candidatus Methylomirabilales bacterium]
MKTFTSLLEEALEGWSDARFGLIAEVENIPARQFEFCPTPAVRSIREVVVHILEVAMMMTGELTRVDTNFHRAPWPKLLRRYAQAAYRVKTKADAVKLLKSQFTQAEKQFLKAGELHMLQLIERFDGELGTRLAWLHHGIAHEMYHTGQLTVYQRLMRIEPALTKRIRG